MERGCRGLEKEGGRGKSRFLSPSSQTDRRHSCKRTYITSCSNFRRTRLSHRFRRNRRRLATLPQHHRTRTCLPVCNTIPSFPFRFHPSLRLRTPPVHQLMSRHCLHLRQCSLPTPQGLQHHLEAYMREWVSACHPCCGLAWDCAFQIGIQGRVDDGRLIHQHLDRPQGVDDDDAMKTHRTPRTSRPRVIGTTVQGTKSLGRRKRIFSEIMCLRTLF